jgi:hypothetical protein
MRGWVLARSLRVPNHRLTADLAQRNVVKHPYLRSGKRSPLSGCGCLKYVDTRQVWDGNGDPILGVLRRTWQFPAIEALPMAHPLSPGLVATFGPQTLVILWVFV